MLVPILVVLFPFTVTVTPISLEKSHVLPAEFPAIPIPLHAAIRDRFIHALRDDAV